MGRNAGLFREFLDSEAGKALGKALGEALVEPLTALMAVTADADKPEPKPAIVPIPLEHLPELRGNHTKEGE